jgi:hypothetical protein
MTTSPRRFQLNVSTRRDNILPEPRIAKAAALVLERIGLRPGEFRRIGGRADRASPAQRQGADEGKNKILR